MLIFQNNLDKSLAKVDLLKDEPDSWLVRERGMNVDAVFKKAEWKLARRMPDYLSPSALGTYEKSVEEYYMAYLAPNRPPRFPQTPAMAVGSAFDAFVKSFLHDRIYGKNHKESAKYGTRTIFEAQVEPQNRDICWRVGAYLFAAYKESGALADLMLEIQDAVDQPRFEFEVKGVVDGRREGVAGRAFGVPLLGKPDIRFINSKGAHVIFDWKVNGFYAKGNTSPMAGFVECREQDGIYWKRNGSHKDVFLTDFKGMQINCGCFLEDTNIDWATQLAVYGWLLGEPVGVENVVGIDQIACHGGKRFKAPDGYDYPNLRIASHRTRISSVFQFSVHRRFSDLWSLINTEPLYFFRELSFEDSKIKQAQLDERGALYKDDSLSVDEKAMLEWSRGAY